MCSQKKYKLNFLTRKQILRMAAVLVRRATAHEQCVAAFRDEATASSTAGAVTSLISILVGKDVGLATSAHAVLASKLLLPLWQIPGPSVTIGEEYAGLLRATTHSGRLTPAPHALQYFGTVTTLLQHVCTSADDAVNPASAVGPLREPALESPYLRALRRFQRALRLIVMQWLRHVSHALQQLRSAGVRAVGALTAASHDPSRPTLQRCTTSLAVFTLLRAAELVQLALDVHTARAFLVPGRTLDAGLALAGLSFVSHHALTPSDVSWARQYRLLGVLLAIKCAMKAVALLSGAWMHAARVMHQHSNAALQGGAAAVNSVQPEEPLSSVAAEHNCPLCLQPRNHASCVPCGHIFCWGCIVQALMHQQACPVCRAPTLPQQVLHLAHYR